MKALEIISIIEQTAIPAGAASWDKCGVQVAGRRENVSSLAVALDPTLETIERALALGVDFILTHHPLSMQPRYLDTVDSHYRTVAALLESRVWLYGAHTSLDANPRGPVSWLAEELELEACRVLEPTHGIELPQDPAVTLGFGCLGTLPKPMTYAGFCDRLSEVVERQFWISSGPQPGTVSTVGYCTGSGSSLADAAFAQGADVFITGDVKYHTALDAIGNLIDVGHFSLEEEMMRRFALLLGERLPTVDIFFLPAQDPMHLALQGAR